MTAVFLLFISLFFTGGEKDPQHSFAYFHAPDASKKTLALIEDKLLIFEIDLAFADTAFYPAVLANRPYIGHPETFYTLGNFPFPKDNVSLCEFETFMRNHPHVKVLIDLKDQRSIPYLREMVGRLGKDRFIVHAFIKNWTELSNHLYTEPHWEKEDLDLFELNEVLVELDVPLIANCRGICNQNIEEREILQDMLKDAKMCKSVVALGFYYSDKSLPVKSLLREVNQEGYYAWINLDHPDSSELKDICFIGMTDFIDRCTEIK